MSREFNNGVTTDLMTYALTDLVGVEQYTHGTMLAVVRIMETNDNTWMSIIEGNAPTSGEVFAMGRRSNGGLYYAEGSSPVDSSDTPASGTAWTISDSDNWCILAITKPTGTVATSFHKIPIGGTRLTAVAAATQGNANPIGVSITLGGAADPGFMRLAVVAILHGIVLTTTQLDAIHAARTTESIIALCDANSWVVDDSNAFATNLAAANTHQTAINGTSDNADDPASWVYGIAGDKSGSAVLPGGGAQVIVKAKNAIATHG
jgi:hypothetical protein